MEQVLSRLSVPTISGWRAAPSLVRLWLDVWSERRTLARLDARILADIGLGEGEVSSECRRRFYDLPRARAPRGW